MIDYLDEPTSDQIFEFIEVNRIDELVIRSNAFNSDTLHDLLLVLGQYPNVKTLFFTRRTPILFGNIYRLQPNLCFNKTLTELHLGLLKFSDAGTTILAGTLLKLNHLICLGLP